MPSSRSVAFRREAIDAAGGYPEWLDIGEDMYVDHRWRELGLDMRFVPEAVVRWRLRTSLRDTWVQYFRYARGDAIAGMHADRHALRFGVYGAALFAWGSRGAPAQGGDGAAGGVAYARGRSVARCPRFERPADRAEARRSRCRRSWRSSTSRRWRATSMVSDARRGRGREPPSEIDSSVRRRAAAHDQRERSPCFDGFSVMLALASLLLAACGGGDDEGGGHGTDGERHDRDGAARARRSGTTASGARHGGRRRRGVDRLRAVREVAAAMASAANAIPAAFIGSTGDLDTSLEQMRAFAEAAPEEIGPTCRPSSRATPRSRRRSRSAASTRRAVRPRRRRSSPSSPTDRPGAQLPGVPRAPSGG